MTRTILVVGGTSGAGLAVAKSIVAHGENVIVAGSAQDRVDTARAELGSAASGLVVDLADVESIPDRLAGVGPINGIILAAGARSRSTISDLAVDESRRALTIKLLGYPAVIAALRDRIEASAESGIVLFGGVAKDHPYPGSLIVSTVNGGIASMVTALASELAPIRVNGIHPGVIVDSPLWSALPPAAREPFEARTPTGQLVTTADVVKTVGFLMGNRAMSGANLRIDRGFGLV